MAITSTKIGNADDTSILVIQVVRVPASGDLQVDIHYDAGGTSKQLKLTPTDGFKTSIEATYAEIKTAIDAAEGLS